MEIDEVLFANLRDAFTDEWKKIEPYISRRPLTKNLEKRESYRTNLVKAFNKIAAYLLNIFQSDSVEIQLDCVARIKPYISKCKTAFRVLKLTYDWPKEDLKLIDIRRVVQIQDLPTTSGSQGGDTASGGTTSATVAQDSSLLTSDDDDDDESIDKLIQNLSNQDINAETNVNDNSNDSQFQQANSDSSDIEQRETDPNTTVRNNIPIDTENLNQSQQNEVQENNTMVQTSADFFKMAAPVLNYKYEGDALKLESFIEDMELVEAMAEDANKAICFKFIKTKIAGRAREYVPKEADSVAKISEALRKHIKPESSLVVEGRLTALRVFKGNFTKFSEEAERLAEAFRRSLRSEGYLPEMAHELTVRKTQELCRRTARSDVVKGIIASTKFDTPAEVIAKLVTENETARKEYKEKNNLDKRSKNPNNKKFDKKFDKNGQNFNKNNQKFNGNRRFNKNQNQNQNQNGQRGNREQYIRVVQNDDNSNAGEGTSQGPTEQVFRLAPS